MGGFGGGLLPSATQSRDPEVGGCSPKMSDLNSPEPPRGEILVSLHNVN